MEKVQDRINAAVEMIIQELLREQFATTEILSEKVGDGDICRRALTKLSRARAITKRVVEGSEGYPVDEWTFQNPDRFRGKGPLAVIDEVFGKAKGSGLIYGRYASLGARIKLTTPCLAGVPGKDGQLIFRRLNGKIWLMPCYFAAMFRDAARRADGLSDRARRAASKWIDFEEVLIDVHPTYEKLIAPEGKGIYIGESLPIGTEIPINMAIPTTQLTAEQAIDILHTAGKWVGFSLAKAKHGWGRFEVIKFK